MDNNREKTTELSEKSSPAIEEMDQETREEVDQLREEIIRDRRETEETIDSIRDRLTPEHLKDQAQEKIREVTIERAKNMAQQASSKSKDIATNAYGSVKDYILPASLIGIGLAWITRNYKAKFRYQGAYSVKESLDNYTHRYHDTEYDTGDSSKINDLTSKGQAVAQNVKNKAAEIRDNARDRVSEVGGQTGEMVGLARDKATETYDQFNRQARQKADMARRKGQQTLQENPLLLAGALFAVGSVLGYLIPQSRMEDEWLGKTSDELKEKTMQMGKEKLEQVESAAKETGKAAIQKVKEEVNKKGLV